MKLFLPSVTALLLTINCWSTEVQLTEDQITEDQITKVHEESLDSKTVIACGHPDYPPWNWKQGGKILGACAEVTAMLFENIGLKVNNIYAGPWKRCQRKVEKGTVDVNICAFINDDRKTYSTFIQTPMGHNTTSVFVPWGKEFPFTTWNDLKGLKVVMVRGVSMGQDFDSFIENHTHASRVNTREQAFEFLTLGRADFLATGRHIGILQRNLYGYSSSITVLPTPIKVGNLHISISNKSRFLKHIPELEAQLKEPDYYQKLETILSKYTLHYIRGRDNISPPEILESPEE
ncbi:transporter substrate-binding domain-containing protein [Litoribacillus peritrichatus]|uniref:Solute-binding protein family 3/N-terminal domain-containing protein n=1 Tax=Litoribacillus peritrichatus TaxID=718191 RepID=A0ABP7MW69_9GAMM